ncbi:COP9 signalosome complex subunit 9 isoform X1 [Sminthopsis crassicaudata]|uniref:COP9 signalosome complex subunit 9 isoform X1 n=1 Tax=Sarcophilus harrisii TaxID=9305 RepID=UPI001301C601|nr:COP9 signalosome complex subunit 9 isoform X1 [Sarcophilus harrisii]
MSQGGPREAGHRHQAAFTSLEGGGESTFARSRVQIEVRKHSEAGGSTGLLMDLAANEKAVHADFFNDFEDLFDDDDIQ